MIPRVLLGCAIVCACACAAPEQHSTEIVGWSSVPNAYAEHFEVQVKGRERRILVFGPGGRADTIAVLSVRGSAESGAVKVPVPLERVAVVSTTHLPYFEALHAATAVVGVAHVRSLRDGCFLEQVESGHTVEISRADGLDKERLIALAPQALFNYPFGKEMNGPGLATSTIPVTEYLEAHPLGRAEWIRFFGLLLAKEDLADSLFRAIEHRYVTLREMGTSLEKDPVVCFASNWEKTWYAPPSNSYMATLIDDAGGRYWFADSVSNGNIAVPLERLLMKAGEADHFGLVLATDGGMDAMRIAGGDPRIAALGALRKGGFYANSTASDIFGNALLEPDVLLKDLRCIFRPGVCPSYTPRYFFPLGQ